MASRVDTHNHTVAASKFNWDVGRDYISAALQAQIRGMMLDISTAVTLTGLTSPLAAKQRRRRSQRLLEETHADRHGTSIEIWN
jgi:hypothetical protein